MAVAAWCAVSEPHAAPEVLERTLVSEERDVLPRIEDGQGLWHSLRDIVLDATGVWDLAASEGLDERLELAVGVGLSRCWGYGGHGGKFRGICVARLRRRSQAASIDLSNRSERRGRRALRSGHVTSDGQDGKVGGIALGRLGNPTEADG
jgi:hypothetical protein